MTPLSLRSARIVSNLATRLPTLICITSALLAGCATSPTGRKQLIAMPDGQMNQMGVQAFDQMKQERPASKNTPLTNYVRCVAEAVAAEAKESAKVEQWEVVVFEDETANAFALPGGKIGVHTGILPIANTPGRLAAVLGHEVGHVIARHGNERVSEGLAVQGGMLAVGAMFEPENRGKWMALLGVGAQFGVLLPHSRAHESEADWIGLDLMSRAGFDPKESVALWENMKKAGGGQPPEFVSTHPSHETRIAQLHSKIPEYTPIFEKAKAAGKNPRCIAP